MGPRAAGILGALGLDLRFLFRFLFAALVLAPLLAVTGCATPSRPPESPPPVQVRISESIWWQVDSDIGAASLAAASLARKDAGGAIERWKALASQRTEADFIPWFSGYWTQQWLAVKMAWYQLNAAEGADAVVMKLATYLQEQYQDRVLNPVAKEIDPDEVRAHTTSLYVRSLGEQLQTIPSRNGVPQPQFDQRLKDIPAITLAPPPAHDASLFDLVHARPATTLPAYAALIADIRKRADETGSGQLNARISPLARRASEKLAARLASSGGASAASALFGRVAGLMISLGATGFGAIAHEKDRPEMEARLREDLNTALDEMSLGLLEDRITGVLAGVQYISGQIDSGLRNVETHPIPWEPAPQELPLPGVEGLPSQENGSEVRP